MRKIKVVVLLVQQLQHGFTKNAKVSPNLTVAHIPCTATPCVWKCTPYSGFFKTNIMNIILYGHIVYMYVSLLSEIIYYNIISIHQNVYHSMRSSMVYLDI